MKVHAGTPPLPLVPEEEPEEPDEDEEEDELLELLEPLDDVEPLLDPPSFDPPPLVGAGNDALVSSSVAAGVAPPRGMSVADSAHADTAAAARTRQEPARARADFIEVDPR